MSRARRSASHDYIWRRTGLLFALFIDIIKVLLQWFSRAKLDGVRRVNGTGRDRFKGQTRLYWYEKRLPLSPDIVSYIQIRHFQILKLKFCLSTEWLLLLADIFSAGRNSFPITHWHFRTGFFFWFDDLTWFFLRRKYQSVKMICFEKNWTQNDSYFALLKDK